MSVFALLGKARAGKDSTIEIARRLLAPREVIRVSFADGVREEGLASGEWNGTVPYTPDGRLALQRIGMRRREEDVDYWVKRAIAKVPPVCWTSRRAPVVFFSDVRFDNEYETLRFKGAHMVRVVRKNRDGSPFDNGLSPEAKAHASETELDRRTGVPCMTASNLEGLERAVKKMLRYYSFLP